MPRGGEQATLGVFGARISDIHLLLDGDRRGFRRVNVWNRTTQDSAMLGKGGLRTTQLDTA